jgi:hypothetical protein
LAIIANKLQADLSSADPLPGDNWSASMSTGTSHGAATHVSKSS